MIQRGATIQLRGASIITKGKVIQRRNIPGAEQRSTKRPRGKKKQGTLWEEGKDLPGGERRQGGRPKVAPDTKFKKE